VGGWEHGFRHLLIDKCPGQSRARRVSRRAEKRPRRCRRPISPCSLGSHARFFQCARTRARAGTREGRGKKRECPAIERPLEITYNLRAKHLFID